MRLQIAIPRNLMQKTFGGSVGETEIPPHSSRLQGYKLLSNHPFVQLLDGECQVLVVTPDDDTTVEGECAELFRVKVSLPKLNIRPTFGSNSFFRSGHDIIISTILYD